MYGLIETFQRTIQFQSGKQIQLMLFLPLEINIVFLSSNTTVNPFGPGLHIEAKLCRYFFNVVF